MKGPQGCEEIFTCKKPLVVVAIQASTGEKTLAIKELKDAIHAPNLLLHSWLVICQRIQESRGHVSCLQCQTYKFRAGMCFWN